MDVGVIGMGVDRMAKKKGASSRRVPRTGSALLCCALLAVLLYLSGGVKEYRGVRGTQAEIAESRATLERMQAQPPADLDAEMERQYRETLAARQGIMIDDVEAEQQKILAMTDADCSKADLARWFDGTAIVGDSIITEVRSYGWLDAPIIAKGGVHLSVELPLLDEVEAAHPKMIFLCFGMNDVGVFRERVDRYVERYSNVIRRLQRNLPDAVIYVHATQPVTETCAKKEPQYQYIDLYNSEMEKACPELGVYFIDSSFLLRARPEMYNPDGRHPRKNYFPLWLTYLADITGLSDVHD